MNPASPGKEANPGLALVRATTNPSLHEQTTNASTRSNLLARRRGDSDSTGKNPAPVNVGNGNIAHTGLSRPTSSPSSVTRTATVFRNTNLLTISLRSLQHNYNLKRR